MKQENEVPAASPLSSISSDDSDSEVQTKSEPVAKDDEELEEGEIDGGGGGEDGSLQNRLRNFEVLDDLGNDEGEDMEVEDSDSDVPVEEIEAMLEEGRPIFNLLTYFLVCVFQGNIFLNCKYLLKKLLKYNIDLSLHLD